MSLGCLIVCIAMLLMVVDADRLVRPEVRVVAFGSPAPFNLATLSRWEPVWEVAVADLAERYRDTLTFTYQRVPARNCLETADHDGDVLADWYYKRQSPAALLLFVTTGVEMGKKVRSQKAIVNS